MSKQDFIWTAKVLVMMIVIIIMLMLTEMLPAAEPEFWTTVPVRQLTARHSYFEDIIAHCQVGKEIITGDAGDTAHETTHRINAQCRQELGHDLQAFYCLNDRTIVLHNTTKITLADVADRVPEGWRNYDYGIYLVKQQAAWNATPTYILDEYAAYIVGAAVRSQQHIFTDDDAHYLDEFHVFADTLDYVVQQREPTYSDMAKLHAAVEWMDRYGDILKAQR